MRSIEIMIVEDVPEMAELLKQMIEDVPGWRMGKTLDTVRAARVELTRNRPDLILLDEVFPGESIDELIAEASGAGVKILLVSSIQDPAAAGRPVRELPQGVSARLPKPTWKTIFQDKPNYVRTIRSLDWSL